MPKLSSITLDNVPQSVVVYGPPKSGKTELCGKLALFMNVIYVNLENGLATLLKLPPAAQERVDVITVPDTHDNPIAIDTALKLAQGKPVMVCEAHGKVNCSICKSKNLPMQRFSFNELDSNSVVVFDSLSQISSSSQAHVTKNLNLETQAMEFKHWKHQGILLSRFLDFIQNARYNVVVIAHDDEAEAPDGSSKIQPVCGSRNFGRSVPKYFGHVVYTTVKNRKHMAVSSTTAETRILAGSRTDAVVDVSDPKSFAAIFGKTVEL